MAEPARQRSRRNAATAFAVLAILTLMALVPLRCRDEIEPHRRYPTGEAARRAPDAHEWVPALLPPGATDVNERHGRGRRFMRFTADSATMAQATAGMQPLDLAAVRRVPVPTPGWSGWWSISPRTLQGGQGKQLRVYRVENPRDRGYLAVDTRSGRAYYWAVPE
jgi:hypothetical protein